MTWLSLLAATSAQADPNDTTEVHLFASEGGLLTTANNYLAYTEHGTLEFGEAGINVEKQLGDRLTAGLQVFGQDLGGTSYNAQLDWFGLDYHWQDWLGFRAGRVKIPFGLYNDIQDIDAALPVILLPQSIYPLENRTFTLAQTGVDVYGFRRLGDAGGALQYEAYVGALSFSLSSSGTTEIDDSHVPYVAGGRLVYETPVDGLRVAASLLAGKIDGDFTMLVPTPGPETAFEISGVQPLGSIEYIGGGFQLAAEYGRNYTTTTIGPAMPTKQTSEQMYGLAGYRWVSWLETTAYYSLLYPDVADRDGIASHQHDAALCLRFDLTPHWLVKLEGHFMRGTAALSSALNDNLPLDQLTNQWELFAAKTTVYF